VSVIQGPPPRSIPTPQHNFVPSAVAPSDLTQISSHISTNSLPPNGALAQTADAPPQQSPQITPPLSQPVLPYKLPPMPEEWFKIFFMQFGAATGFRYSERDLIIEGRPINLWALHKAVFLRNGFDAVRLGIIHGLWLWPIFVLGKCERRVGHHRRPFGFPTVCRWGCWSACTMRACHSAPTTTVIQ
jgi:hypothetical protein